MEGNNVATRVKLSTALFSFCKSFFFSGFLSACRVHTSSQVSLGGVTHLKTQKLPTFPIIQEGQAS